MDGNTRARKEARLARLRAQVAELEQELAVLHMSESDGEADATDSAASAASVAVPGEQAWDVCNVAATTEEEDENEQSSTSSDDDDPLPVSGSLFTGPAGGGFYGGSPPSPLTRVNSAQGAGAVGGDLSVHRPITHAGTIHCPPCSISADCNCVSGQLGLGCCVEDDPEFGVGDLYNYLKEQRDEALRTSNHARDGNNVQRKRIYRHCAVSATAQLPPDALSGSLALMRRSPASYRPHLSTCQLDCEAVVLSFISHYPDDSLWLILQHELGYRWRRRLPDCVVAAVRSAYPSANGHYMGFMQN